MKMIVEPAVVDTKMKSCPVYSPPTCRHKCSVY